VVESSLAAGALEGYSMTIMSAEMIRPALPHELAHTWWGGLVPNTYMVDMWNEAFASYSERLLREAEKPEAPRGLRAGEERVVRWKLSTRVPITGSGDALDHPQAMAGYQKGAAVLHMFRRTVGEEAFHHSLSRFVVERSGQASTWRDFQRVAERVVNHDLGPFFDPWLTRDDAPRLQWLSARQAGDRLEAEIELLNPGYRLRLPIGIDTDAERRVEVVDVAGAHTRVHLTVNGRVRRLVLDPAGDFLLEPGISGSHPWSIEPSSAGSAGEASYRLLPPNARSAVEVVNKQEPVRQQAQLHSASAETGRRKEWRWSDTWSFSNGRRERAKRRSRSASVSWRPSRGRSLVCSSSKAVRTPAMRGSIRATRTDSL
jgi:hypothetical protein